MAPLSEPAGESPAPAEWRTDAPLAAAADVAWLRGRGLLVPVAGIAAAQIVDTYNEARDGARRHHAVDILAPRGAEVLAAEDGVVLRVGTNALGGNVVWATDENRRFAYYYAHLERWARGLREGQSVSRGEVIGYVGTSGNAPRNAPHLHFQLLRITDAKRYSTDRHSTHCRSSPRRAPRDDDVR